MTTSLAENGVRSQASRSSTYGLSRSALGFDPFATLRSNWAFDYDVTRTDAGYEVEVPVPGYRPEQIEITFKDAVLLVSGKSERRTFTRSFTVPEDVDQDNISAHVADGMLTLTLNRRPEAQPKRISIN